MKKFVSSSGSSKLNFVKRVLLRPSSRHRGDSASSSPAASSSTITMEDCCIAKDNPLPKSPDSHASAAKFQSELQLLRSQIETLQISVNQMQNDNEAKEQALVALAKDKEQLTIDLRRHKRTNLNLRQQLEDERTFYYKEKEQYCIEMNNVKKLKRKTQSSEALKVQESMEKNINSCSNDQKEIANLKNTLNQTLEANYNLSVKFLRMKNTKLSLKKQINKMAAMHEKSTEFYKAKVDEFQALIDSIVQEQFYKPIPPSNKKYLHLLKHNGSLLYENLSLQIAIDHLNKEIERFKVLQDINETNRRLQLIHHNDDPNKGINNSTNISNSAPEIKCKKCNLTKVESNRTNATNETKSSKSAKSLKSRSSQTTTTRSRHSIQALCEKNHHSNQPKEEKHHRHKQDLNKSQHEKFSSEKSLQGHKVMSENSVEVVQIERHGKLTSSEVMEPSNSKFDLMTVSNSKISNYKSDCSIVVCRARVPEIFARNESQSAPEIINRAEDKV